MKSSKAAKPKRSAAAAVAAAPPRRAPCWPYLLGLLVAFLALYQVYSPALNGPFLLDDTSLPYMLPNYSVLPLKDWITGVRPLLMFSYWLNFKQSGNEVTYGYHLVNLLLHFLNGALIFLAIRKLLGFVQA